MIKIVVEWLLQNTNTGATYLQSVIMVVVTAIAIYFTAKNIFQAIEECLK